jgi:D-alanyl-D-alanine carboxypeptidase/D-alanyl-D-alanine-endopeptidase (penicillin-binding protein 4)
MVWRSGGGVGRRSQAVATVLLGAGVVGLVAVLATVLVLRSSTSPADARAGADVDAVASAVAAAAASSTTASTRPATTTTVPVCDRRRELDAGTVEPPPEWASRVAAAASDASWGDVERSISVWVEGYGEIVAVAPDLALLPASNEKVLTALGARLVLDPSGRFRTEVRTTGDRLVLVADGDPTLRTHGPHSLAALAGQVRAAGIVQVDGVLVDATRFEPATTARGWQDWHIPTYVGPMSALVVDDNRGRADAGYLTDPALGNGEAFAAALRAAGVRVDGEVDHGIAGRDSSVVAAVESATVAELTHTMLLRSDNEIAESLVREVGGGRTEVGMDRIAAALEPWCLHLVGEGADGSGLSRDDRRSAREWRRLLQVALEQPWAEEVWSGLPVAGRSGTLAGRLRGPATLGIVRAKTGTIIGGSALSGYATLPDGRQVVFSIVVNGEPGAATRAIAAVDRLVAVVTAG